MEVKHRIAGIINIESLKSRVNRQFKWGEDFCSGIVDEYCKFLAIKIMKNDVHTNTYGGGWFIDKVWLYHFSNYKEYVMDCKWICHDVIDYYEFERSTLESSLDVYENYFVQVPKQYWQFDSCLITPPSYSDNSTKVFPKNIDSVLSTKGKIDEFVLNHTTSAFSKPIYISKEDVKHLRIGIKTPNKSIMFFRVHPFETCLKLFKSFTMINKLDIKYYQFTFGNSVVQPHQKIIHIQNIKDKDYFEITKKVRDSYGSKQSPTPPIEPQQGQRPKINRALNYRIHAE